MRRVLYRLLLFSTIFVTFLSGDSLLAVGFDETFFAENNIIYYDPDGKSTPSSCGSSGSDCSIAGDTKDEKLWSGLTGLGFTPEQAIGIMANSAHEGGSPARQEDCYNGFRDKGYLTQEGNPYTVYTTSNGSVEHFGPESSCGNYRPGNVTQGIGLGMIQWTSSGRRIKYLEIIESINPGLIERYFANDAYKSFGRLNDNQLKNKIVADTGSEADYIALWCATLKMIKYEMVGDGDINNPLGAYKGFFNNDTPEEYAAWTSVHYEGCNTCQQGEASYNARVASAADYRQKYLNGEFAHVGGGTFGGSVSDNGSNVTVIGDGVTEGSKAKILEKLPQAEIDAASGRGWSEGVAIAQGMALRDTIVFALGTNDTNLSQDQIDEILAVTGSVKSVVFMTGFASGSGSLGAGKDYSSNNLLILKAAADNDNVSVMDWNTAAGEDADKYISSDGIHPTEDGKRLFADILYEAIGGDSPASGGVSCGESDYTDDTQQIFLQGDPQWGTIPYGNCGDGSTIGSSGCGPSAMAMVITALTGTTVTPDITAQKAVAQGYRACGNGSAHAIAYIAQDYGLTVYSVDFSDVGKINEILRGGAMILTSGSGAEPYTAGGHFVAVRGVTAEGKWKIFDSKGNGKKTSAEEWEPSVIIQGNNNGSKWGGYVISK
jgi:hypothetical protein